MYIEVSGVRPGAKAQLASTLISPQSGKCLQFWYHMYGYSVGKLNVYLWVTGSSFPNNPVWSRTKDQGNQWFVAQVSIQNIFKQLKVCGFIFEWVDVFICL